MDSLIRDLFIQTKFKDNERLALSRQVKKLEAEVEQGKATLMQELSKLGLSSMDLGDLGSMQVVHKQKPYIADFTALEAYIVEHRATDLLQKRLTESAVKLRWEDGIVIPGVGLSDEEKLQLR